MTQIAQKAQVKKDHALNKKARKEQARFVVFLSFFHSVTSQIDTKHSSTLSLDTTELSQKCTPEKKWNSAPRKANSNQLCEQCLLHCKIRNIYYYIPNRFQNVALKIISWGLLPE